MAGVMPKVKFYAFLSIICLMFNVAIFTTSLLSDASTDISGFTSEDTYTDDDVLIDNESAVLTNFVTSAGTSFIPFFNLLPLATISDLPLAVSVIAGIVITIISAFQVFLLAVIIINLTPKVLGSGFDV